jgi:hypothetical protein
MSAYYMDEAAFDLPEIGLVDRTVTTLGATTEEGHAHTITVFRNPIPEGATLAALVEQNLREASVRLGLHTVLDRRELEVGGLPALGLSSRWRGKNGMIYTRQAHFFAGGSWLVFACNADLADRARCDAIMDHALATFRPRD